MIFFRLLLILLFIIPAQVYAAAKIERSRNQSSPEAGQARQQQATETSSSSPQRLRAPQRIAQEAPKRKSTGEGVSRGEEVVNLADIWRGFETSSVLWPDIIEKDIKILTVQKYVEWFREQGAIIQKPPYQYVDIIDTIAEQNPGLLESSFKDVMMFTAIMEYDFHNGEDKDALAKKVLGEDLYRQNRKRFGLE